MNRPLAGVSVVTVPGCLMLFECAPKYVYTHACSQVLLSVQTSIAPELVNYCQATVRHILASSAYRCLQAIGFLFAVRCESDTDHIESVELREQSALV